MTRVVVYRNLRFANRVVWSVAAATSTDGKGKLIGYVEGDAGVTLSNARAVVSGRAHAVRSGQREVCAWIAGNLCPDVDLTPALDVTYDRDAMTFCERATGAPWHSASVVTFSDRMRGAL